MRQQIDIKRILQYWGIVLKLKSWIKKMKIPESSLHLSENEAVNCLFDLASTYLSDFKYPKK